MMMKSKEEVLMSLHTHHEEELGITWKSAIEAMQTYADQENAELKEKIEELGGQSILDTMQRNKALRDEVAQLRSEIASLRSRLEDCKRRDITGHSI